MVISDFSKSRSLIDFDAIAWMTSLLGGHSQLEKIVSINSSKFSLYFPHSAHCFKFSPLNESN